tara:strand:- start:346 stop:1305 length:960 start_codon:yes stop_codon:yes gene_type:complete
MINLKDIVINSFWNITAQESISQYVLEIEEILNLMPLVGGTFIGVSVGTALAITAGVGAVVGAAKTYSADKQNEKVRGAAATLKGEQLAISDQKYAVDEEKHDIATDQANVAFTQGSIVGGMANTRAVKNLMAGKSASAAKSGFAGSAGAQYAADQMMGDVLAKNKSNMQKLTDTRAFATRSADLNLESAGINREVREGEIEKEYQSTIAANPDMGFMDYAGGIVGGGVEGLKFGASVVSGAPPGASDRDLKKDIKKVGKSPSGITKYTFRYKDPEKYGYGLFKGTMSDEVPDDARFKAGKYDMVNYEKIDVDFEKVGV